MVDMSRLKTIDLHDYTHLLMVDGRYADIGKKLKQDITSWVNDGGVLVTIQSASTWAESLCFQNGDCDEERNDEAHAREETKAMPYADFTTRERNAPSAAQLSGHGLIPPTPSHLAMTRKCPFSARAARC